MKIIALDIKNLNQESIYMAGNFEVFADFKMDSTNSKKVKQIDITVKNSITSYNYLSGNFCFKGINTKLDMHAIELHIQENPNPIPRATGQIIPKTGQDIILNKGTILIVTAIIYKNVTNPTIKQCHYPNYNAHPQTKNGAVIVSI